MSAKKRLVSLVLAMAMGASLMLTACTPAPANTASSGSGSTSSTDGASSGTDDTATTGYPGTADANSVTINIASEPPELNSILTTDSTAISILRDTMQGLTVLDQENNAVPGVAESWTISDDGLVYTFKLRQDSKWTNGDPVTAKDFYFAISTHFTAETAANYASTWAPYIKGANEYLNGKAKLEDVGLKVVDDYTFEITLARPCTYFLSICAFPSFLPVNEKAYNEIGATAYGKDADKIVTNGPYKVEKWIHEDSVVLTKDTSFWDSASYSSIPTINMKMISESNAALNAFQAGEVDMIGLSGEQVKLMQSEGITAPKYEDGSPGYIEFNIVREGANGKALAQKEVRQALTLALDVQSYITNIAQNSNLVANSFTPNVVLGADGKYGDKLGEILKRPTDGNYADIKKMFEDGLAKAGVAATDLKLSILTDEGDSAQKMCAFFQQQWKDNLGIDVAVNQRPFKSRLADQSSGNFDMCFALWGPDYNDAMTYLDMFITNGGNNHTGWSNAEFDELIESAYNEVDATKREGTLIEAEKLLLEEMPIGPVYHRVRDFICSDKLSGVVRTAFQEISMKWAVMK